MVQAKHESKRCPHSVFDIPTYASTLDREQSSSPVPQSSSPKHSRRYTIPDVKVGSMSKERWHLQRTLSPLHASEDSTAKVNKKQKKVQRSRDRNDKTDLLQPSRPPMLADIPPCSMSITGEASQYCPPSNGGTDYTDFMPQRSVTESLNPSMHCRALEAEFPGSTSAEWLSFT